MTKVKKYLELWHGVKVKSAAQHFFIAVSEKTGKKAVETPCVDVSTIKYNCREKELFRGDGGVNGTEEGAAVDVGRHDAFALG